MDAELICFLLGSLLLALGLGKAGIFAKVSQCCCPFLLSGALDSAAHSASWCLVPLPLGLPACM